MTKKFKFLHNPTRETLETELIEAEEGIANFLYSLSLRTQPLKTNEKLQKFVLDLLVSNELDGFFFWDYLNQNSTNRKIKTITQKYLDKKYNK
jgi:hypothetical protein